MDRGVRLSFLLFLFVPFLLLRCVDAKDEIPANIIAGKKIARNTVLKKGDKRVGWFEGKAFLVEVLEVNSDNKLKILWVETDEKSEDIAPHELYEFGDASQLTKSRTALLPESFRPLDKNRDGQIGLYEWDRAKYAEFRKLDKNNDGFLTPKELLGKSLAIPANSAPGTPVAATPAKTEEVNDKPAATTATPTSP